MTVQTADNAKLIVEKAVAAVGEIATLPEVTIKIIEIVEDPKSTARDIHDFSVIGLGNPFAEQHQPVGPGFDEPPRHLAEGAEEGPDFHRQRELNVLPDLADGIQIPLLHLRR